MQIDFVTPNQISDEYMAELKAANSRVFYIDRKGNPLKYLIKLMKLLKKEKYNIIHIHGNSSMMLIDVLPAVVAGIPVRIVHSHNTTCDHICLHKLLNPLFRVCYTHGFACGQDAGRWLYGDRKFIELKNGIDVDNYRFDEKVREQYRTKLGIGDKILLGHVGNFIEQKNHTFLIDLFADLLRSSSNYVLLLISDGALMKEIKNKVNRLGISDNVIFLGKTPKVNKYLQAIDIFLLPSLYEGLPVVLIEAQSTGVPCIVSEKVSAEANLTGTIKFVNIDHTDSWVSEIKACTDTLSISDRYAVCATNQEIISQNGYNVTRNAQLLKQYYKDFLRGKEI
ncbi:MAG: glycosyltransferase [Ruminococcus sp.]|nr:glycosyltransferase [Ruminococcus sp.]